MYKQRDIVLIPFPYSDLTGSKQRPALIISNTLLKGNDLLCCLITSKSQQTDLLLHKKAFADGSLPLKSWVRPYRLFTIDSRIIRRRLARVTESFYQEFFKAIVSYVKLS